MTPFLTEVNEQPAALAVLAQFYQATGMPLLAEWKSLARARGRLLFSGMGTSLFVGESVMGILADGEVEAQAIEAAELLHYPREIDALPVLISQSGESAETRLLAERLYESGPIVAVANTVNSSLGRTARVTLPLMAGGESAISTKTYVNSLALLHIMARSVQGDVQAEHAIDAVAHAATRLLDVETEVIGKAAEMLAAATHLQFIARGPAMVAARQAALTFMEGTRLTCSAISAGAFAHGPVEVAGAGHHAILFIAQGRTYDLMQRLAHRLAHLGSRLVVVTDSPAFALREACVLRVPHLGEDLFPLAAATAQELLLHEVAARRGIVAGSFRHARKITDSE